MMGRVIAMVSRLSLTGYDVVRVLVGAILLTAAGLKGYQLATEPTLGTSLLESRWFLIGVVEFEVLFGFWLLANIWPKPTWAAAIACFSVFACVSLYKALSGYANCGCFGRVPVNPWLTFTLDICIVLALFVFEPVENKLGEIGQGVEPERLRPRLVAVSVLWALVGIPGSFAMASPRIASLTSAGSIDTAATFVILEPQQWIGSRFPLLDYVDIKDRLMAGDWFVLLYHHNCSTCQRVLPQVMRVDSGASGNSRQLALIEVPPYAQGHETPPQAPLWIRGHLAKTIEWFVRTPVLVELRDGVVTEAYPEDRIIAALATRSDAAQQEAASPTPRTRKNLRMALLERDSIHVTSASAALGDAVMCGFSTRRCGVRRNFRR